MDYRRIGIVAALAAIFVLTGCSADDAQKNEDIATDEVTQNKVSQQELTDEDITAAIVTEFLTSDGIPATELNVETKDGIVRLNGAVRSILYRERAEDIASRVKGVRGLVNELEVQAPEVSDEQLRTDVEEALAEGPATDSYEIGVLAEDGTVLLTGTVESYAEATLAKTVAMSVRGVEKVTNELNVEFDESRTDAEIKREIRRRMAWDARIDSAGVNIAVNDGDVILTGAVGSLYESGIAQSLSWVRGVDSVKSDQLEVEWWERDRMLDRDVLNEKSDDAIEDAVRDAIAFDPRVRSFELSVLAEDGEVTLTGTVDTLSAKEAAERTAMNTHGVWEVNNLLKVEPEFEEYVDATITESVEQKLMKNGATEAFDIDVRTEDNEVILEGTVDSVFESKQAREIAAMTPGVKSVDNNLTVEVPTLAERDGNATVDASLAAAIRDQLFWSPVLDSEEIEVEVDDGVAILTGSVETWGQRNVAVKRAKDGGAARVDASGLTVSYGPTDLVPEGGVAY